jgi:hypothetical protein
MMHHARVYRRILLLLAASTLALCACSGGGGSRPHTDPVIWTASPAASPAADVAHPGLALAQRAGCVHPVRLSEPPPFVQEAVDCHDQNATAGGFHVSYYAFGSNTGRDAWLKVAADFGDVGVIRGDRFAIEIPDSLPGLDAAAAKLAKATGGERVT